jgi:phosphatidylglycerophosphatase A
MNIKKWIGSSFYSAYLTPFSPGTSSSIITYIVIWLLKDFISFNTLITLITISIILGIYSIKFFEEDDPKDFTLDEVFAILFISIFTIQKSKIYLLSFFLFRFFDIFKPLGIKYIENITKKNRLFSIYIDDFIAALYTIITLNLLNYAKII